MRIMISKNYAVFVILILFFCGAAFPCDSSINGRLFSPYPDGIKVGEMSLVNPRDDGPDYVLFRFESDNKLAVLLGKKVVSNNKDAIAVVACLNVPIVRPGYRLVIGDCYLNGEARYDIVAIVKNIRAPKFGEVDRVFSADINHGGFVELSASGVVCVNEEYGF